MGGGGLAKRVMVCRLSSFERVMEIEWAEVGDGCFMR